MLLFFLVPKGVSTPKTPLGASQAYTSPYPTMPYLKHPETRMGSSNWHSILTPPVT